MQSINDRVINVPIADEDIIKTVTSLPRSSSNDGFLIVNLKRMKCLKKNEKQEKVQIDQLFEALEYLRMHHLDYKDILPNEVIREFMDDSNDESEPMDIQTTDQGK